ncbi:Aspartate aminotransferase, cytoplasmic [Exophiala dermatitidis]
MGSFTPTSSFSHLDPIPLDAIYSLKETFAADSNENKIILGSGVYRDDASQPWVLPSVQKAEEIVNNLQDPGRYEYLPIPGYAPFYTAARDLLFGDLEGKADRVVSVHTIAGTGANSLGARFLKETTNPSAVWVPDPTWVNHRNIWSLAGVEVKTYPYWNPTKKALDFERLLEVLESEANKGDVIILHACAHNPTGMDPTREQWTAIATLCETKGLFPFFDCAYLGFASGDVDKDAWAVRHFASRGTMELAVAQSFSKNMGLYGERVGALHVLAATADAASKLKGHLARLQRGHISQPPRRGARIAATILTSPSLYQEWLSDLRDMSGRIQDMRRALYDQLLSLGTPGSWEHIPSQIGMFSYTGLTPEQVATIQADSHVYMLKSGRINIAGLTTKNVEYTARAIDAAVRRSPR